MTFSNHNARIGQIVKINETRTLAFIEWMKKDFLLFLYLSPWDLLRFYIPLEVNMVGVQAWIFAPM